MASRILVDLEPLRESRDFRLLFGGQLIDMFGSQLTRVAIPFQVYALTGSSLQVGLVSLAQLVPLVVGALVGGAIGDAVDRRRVMLATSMMLAVTSGALAFNATLAHPSILAIYLISAAAAGLSGAISTACQSAVPSLVDGRHVVAAYASMQVVDQFGMVIAPALSGLLIGVVHLSWVYGLDALTCLAVVATAWRMSPIPPSPDAPRAGLASIVDGMRYIASRQVLLGVYLMDINAMVFGMPRALFPALAATVFHGGAQTLGYLYAAPAAGALAGALTTGWLGRVRRRAWVVIAAVCVWGAAIVAFGLVDVLWIALALLAVAGWADVISAVLRTTILQTSVAESFRSRVSSVQIAVVEGGPRLGDLESGAVATAVSTEFAIVSGGVACIVGALLFAVLLPGFRNEGRRPERVDAGASAPSTDRAARPEAIVGDQLRAGDPT